MLPCTTFMRTIPILLISPVRRALLREHEVIVFQHPLYTYSCPALLKEWLDRDIKSWFCQRAGRKTQLAGKYWRSVITTGEPESAYRYDALNRYPMSVKRSASL
ncbi:NAD(P)H-dependent oxidoreductase [Escherichia coli]